MMSDLIESKRRKPGARGRWIRLADGCEWLLAEVVYAPSPTGLTQPDLDATIDRFYEQTTLGEEIAVADLIGVARILLLVNYELTDEEVCELLCVEPGAEVEALAQEVFAAMFGEGQRTRGFTDWARASLLANGLHGVTLSPATVQDVLAILIATNRTIPEARFIDACRVAQDRDSLERLI